MAFNSSRLKIARRRRGWTKRQLATAVLLHERSIIGYEGGELVPPEHTLAEIAQALQFPPEFFHGPDIVEPSPECASFRSLSAMTAGRRDSVLASGGLAFELCAWIEAKFNLPTPNIPDCRSLAPAAAAQYVRNKWGLGEQPIRNMVHLLESNGVRVFSLAEETKDVDAFSIWRTDVPYVFLNTYKSPERGRFDAAHELGHLVLHRHGGPDGRKTETEADLFASEFLMPAGSVLSAVTTITGIEYCIKLKKIWQVSLAALVVRLYQLKLISEWHYRTLFVEIGTRGYRTTEPSSMPRETSQVFAKVFSALREEGISKEKLASQLCLYPFDLDALIFGLVIVQLAGGRASAGSHRSSTAGRGKLHLV